MQLGYKTLLFDLDGTLTNSEEGIVKCFQHGLRPFGIEENDSTILRNVIGPPLLTSYKQIYGFSDEQAALALATYRERYEEIGKFENRPYHGISELLGKLKAAGYRLILATSKPEHFAVQIMEHFGLDTYFDFICGADETKSRIEKEDVIGEIIRTQPEIDRQNAIMIGDRKYDVKGAANWNLDCIGVLYGFGDRAELEAAGAKYIAETVESLGKLLL